MYPPVPKEFSATPAHIYPFPLIANPWLKILPTGLSPGTPSGKLRSAPLAQKIRGGGGPTASNLFFVTTVGRLLSFLQDEKSKKATRHKYIADCNSLLDIIT